MDFLLSSAQSDGIWTVADVIRVEGGKILPDLIARTSPARRAPLLLPGAWCPGRARPACDSL